MVLKNNELFVYYYIMLKMSFLNSDPLAVDCRLQTAIFSQIPEHK